MNGTSEFNRFLAAKLQSRSENGTLRSLRMPTGLIDFCSNDYLGLATDPLLLHKVSTLLNHEDAAGAGASRLISGNSHLAETLENLIARFHYGDAALLFNSGYTANLGLFAALGQAVPAIVYDEFIHASVHDGLRFARCPVMAFKHNHPDELNEMLTHLPRHAVVAVESIYSMDGDRCKLAEIVEVCNRHGAILSVDEAHSVGIYGEAGKGICSLPEFKALKIPIKVITYGKAFGLHGAAVVASHTVRDYLINYSRPTIYSTFMPPHALRSILAAYGIMPNLNNYRKQLAENIAYFQKRVASSQAHWLQSDTAIQGIVIPDSTAVKFVANRLAEFGLDVRAIVAPTVRMGSERIRISLHSFNTTEHIDRLFEGLILCGHG